MRFHVVFLLVVVLGVATSNGFFLKKAAATLADVKYNLVNDAKTAIADLKESAKLKAKAITGGVKAIGHAKLGLVKGIKHAKLGVLKGIAGAKLAKVAAIKAGKLVFAKTLVAAKLAPVVKAGIHTGAIQKAVSALPHGSGLFQSLKDQLSSAPSSIGNLFSKFGSESSNLIGNNNHAIHPATGVFQSFTDQLSALSSNSKLTIANLLPKFEATGSGIGSLALFPAPSGIPTHINIVTYKNEAPKPSVNNVPSAPVTSYGTPINAIPPSTSYGVPFQR